jgi:hypothetical protein
VLLICSIQSLDSFVEFGELVGDSGDFEGFLFGLLAGLGQLFFEFDDLLFGLVLVFGVLSFLFFYE